MSRFSGVRNSPGVYVLFDVEELPLYAGKSGKLRGRLEQHFIRQDSSATADGLLDIYDILRVAIWYADPESGFQVDAYEAASYQAFRPRWNRAVPIHGGPLPVVTLENADVIIGILDSPEELAVRRQPLERIEAKLLHLIRAVRKAKISGASPGVKQALARHAEELGNSLGGYSNDKDYYSLLVCPAYRTASCLHPQNHRSLPCLPTRDMYAYTEQGLTNDEVLTQLRTHLKALEFETEAEKQKGHLAERTVFNSEDGAIQWQGNRPALDAA